MSQVGMARPATQQSLTARLPEIKHPLSRLGSPANLDIRGTSRAGSVDFSRPGTQASQAGRPLANEATFTPYRRTLHSSAGKLSRHCKTADHHSPLVQYEAIPEGVEVRLGDPSKTKLPIFGNRADLGSRDGSRADMGSRMSGRLSKTSQISAQQRLEIDELEAIIKEKMKTGYHEIKKRFKDNDPEQKGNVSRDGFSRILVTVLNRPLNTSQFARLMERLNMKSKQVINFTEFYSTFREVPSSDYPGWMDPVHRGMVPDKAVMTASQVHTHLKEKARQRVIDLADLIPQCNPDGSGHILKPEFRNVLNRWGFFMDDREFEKLWDKYDPEGYGTVNGERMMKTLGISIQRNGSIAPSSPPMANLMEENEPEEAEVISEGGRKLKKKEIERQRSLNVEKWLQNKFREGFHSMKQDFQAQDPDKTGLVSHDAFRQVLGKYGLTLEKSQLADFLTRCSVQPTRTDVPYREFLHRFQDRSEAGMPHKILTNAKHKFNRAQSPSAKSTLSALEMQLMNMFQRDFLALLGTFHNIDKLGLDAISQEEFRAAVESRFDLEITDSQFRNLVDQVPLDDDGNVKYAEFMAQFDTKGRAASLFSIYTQKPKKYKSIGCLPRDPSPPLPPGEPVETLADPAELGGADRLVVNHEPMDTDEVAQRRSAKELFVIIKDLMKKNYQAVERTFYEIDEKNTQRLTQETMYQLLRRFDISPSITRGEIRDLWKTFITNQDKTLEFLQFTRHFGYSLKSAAYSNAKLSPPKRGDRDCMMRSRKLNCAADMLQDGLRAKVDYMWEDLHREFVSMDPYGTGFVSSDEYQEVMTELCVHLTKHELRMLTEKFDLMKDGRVSYIEFLKPFALRRQVWRHGNNMLSLLQHSQPELYMADIVEPSQKGLQGVTAKIRQKLGGDWKTLRRAFKKLDYKNEGCLSMPEFRSVLKQASVMLDEDEVYHLMTQFDENLSGKIPYNKFINDTFKPPLAPGTAKSMRSSANF